MPEQVFPSREALDAQLAADIAGQLSAAIAERDEATLVVSGGSTPAGLFAILSNTDLNWEKVTVMLADDRWVPLDHADCNEKMVREQLLVNKAATARLLSLVRDYPDTEANLARVTQALAPLNSFDVVVLGMGLDAHTASLFPCSEQIREGLGTIEDAIMTSPQTAPHERITLSRQRIANTHFGALHIVGDNKLAVLGKAVDDGRRERFPIASFVGGADNFTVYWAA